MSGNLSETGFTDDALPFFKGDYVLCVRSVGPVGTAEPENSEAQICSSDILRRSQNLTKSPSYF